jgi:predicted glutamine amidotransferase
MCKIVAFTNTSKLDKKAPASIGGIINKLERDGYGYAIQGSSGVFGEKSVFSSFKSRLQAKNVIDLPIVKPQHLVFGQVGTMSGPGVFHGRTSTNDKGLRNCHPMQRDGWNLIHNGVVTDGGPKYEKLTTNDSEDVLKRLIDGVENVEKYLSGYYAFAAIAPDGRLHVARDSMATLFFAYSSDKETYVFATTESLLRSVAKELKLKVGPIEAMEDNTYCIFDGNQMLHMQAIKPLGYSQREAIHATASLGRTVGEKYGGSIYDATEGWPEYTVGEVNGNNPESHRGKTRRAKNPVAATTSMDTDAYYVYKHEVDNMDRSYSIMDASGNDVDLADFKLMSWREQESCTIVRPDGTILSPNDDEGELFYG